MPAHESLADLSRVIYGKPCTRHAGTVAREETRMEIRRNGRGPSQGRRTASLARCGSTRCSRRRSRPAARRLGHLRARRPHAWHTHPLGQTLIVTAGAAGCSARAGRSRRSGPATSSGSRRARSTGTAQRHDHRMTHIAIQEKLNGKVVDWMEKVGDEQYRRLKERSRRTQMEKRRLERLEVSAIGFGCMGMSFGYGQPVTSARGSADPRGVRARRHLLRHRRGLRAVHQ